MKIVNLTDHAVVVFERDEKTVKKIFPISGKEARIDSESERFENILVRFKYGAVNDLPDEEEGTFLIVSNPVRNAFPHRKDLCSPNASVKDENGANIGCKSLILNPVTQ